MRIRPWTVALVGLALLAVPVGAAQAASVGAFFRYLTGDKPAQKPDGPERTPTKTTYSTRLIMDKGIGLGTSLTSLGFIEETAFNVNGVVLGGGPMMTWGGRTVGDMCAYIGQLGPTWQCGPGIDPYGFGNVIVISYDGSDPIAVYSSVFGDNGAINSPKLFGSNSSQLITHNQY